MLKYDDAGMYIKGMKNENKHIERGKTVRLERLAVTLLFVAGTVFSLLCENYWLIALSYVPFYVFLTYKFFSLDENFFFRLVQSRRLVSFVFSESSDFTFLMLDNFNCVRAFLCFDRFTN